MILDAYVEDMIYPLVVECFCARFQRIFFLSRVMKVAYDPLKRYVNVKKCHFVYMLLNKTCIFAL